MLNARGHSVITTKNTKHFLKCLNLKRLKSLKLSAENSFYERLLGIILYN